MLELKRQLEPSSQKACMTNIVSIKKLNDQLAALNYEPDIGEKDQEERNEYIKHYKSNFHKNNEITDAVKSIFQTVGIIEIGLAHIN
ncbi:hypothetical protein [Parasitella parasitica]|uniref:Uncharacterized protein n=1 Tax=Parasitella parasitica TaxID=35722 RepID=A0A0B7NP88_9FUNG|nr:hypothetical protein [Parasitella parasitica]